VATTIVYNSFIPDNQLIALDTEDEFPDVGNIDIVFDLAGSISKSAHSAMFVAIGVLPAEPFEL
jgi:hypothetical protein